MPSGHTQIERHNIPCHTRPCHEIPCVLCCSSFGTLFLNPLSAVPIPLTPQMHRLRPRPHLVLLLLVAILLPLHRLGLAPLLPVPS